MQTALIISTVAEDMATMRAILGSGCRLHGVADVPEAIQIMERKRYDIVFIDLNILLHYLDGEDFNGTLLIFQKKSPSIEIVIMVAPDQIRKAIWLVKAGAADYITYPISDTEVNLVLETIFKSTLCQHELDYLRDQFWKSEALDVVQTKSPAMVEVFKKVRSVAATKTTVLLTGETGTGKSLIAKLIHQHSNRQTVQFISVHCGAIPDTLLESELFGHERGAFTGALRKKLGKFEIANGGTIFLDEIGTLTPPAQIKLLQVLQDGTFSHVGGEEPIHTNARVIAATNSDLKSLTESGNFRKDLYYRLNVFPIDIPPLRARMEDLPRLISLFLERLNREFQKAIQSVHLQVLEALTQYSWPGNVRELENLMERAYILENASVLTPSSFPQELFDCQKGSTAMRVHTRIPLSDARKIAIEDFERQYIKELLARNLGKIKNSAMEAGITTRQLHKLMSKYGIRKEEYKK
ncbi:MAG: sigma-54 dependent transcriptional regulator [Desulfobacteraceae bacterium]|jgi:DNA-binding NtrC family response regulator